MIPYVYVSVCRICRLAAPQAVLRRGVVHTSNMGSKLPSVDESLAALADVSQVVAVVSVVTSLFSATRLFLHSPITAVCRRCAVLFLNLELLPQSRGEPFPAQLRVFVENLR